MRIARTLKDLHALRGGLPGRRHRSASVLNICSIKFVGGIRTSLFLWGDLPSCGFLSLVGPDFGVAGDAGVNGIDQQLEAVAKGHAGIARGQRAE